MTVWLCEFTELFRFSLPLSLLTLEFSVVANSVRMCRLSFFSPWLPVCNSAPKCCRIHSDYATNEHVQSVKISKREIKFVRIVENRQSRAAWQWLLLCLPVSFCNLWSMYVIIASQPKCRKRNHFAAGVRFVCNGTEEIVIMLVWCCIFWCV